MPLPEPAGAPFSSYDPRYAPTAPLPTALDCWGHRRGLVVTDSAGQKLAYVFFDDEPGRRIKLKEWRANHITLRNCCYSRRYGGPGARTFR